jgi:CubicO group peptidase (beta-lactamase class C family)
MRKLHLLAVPLACLLAVAALDAQAIRSGTPASVGMSAERLAKIKPAMQAVVDAKEIAAVETLVARRGVVVHHERIGVEPGAIFRLASMTKPVTSVAVMMLVEDGKLLLSDPVSRFIPSFKDMRVLVAPSATTNGNGPTTVPAERQITLEDLMTHRSGLVYSSQDKGSVGEMYRKNGVYEGLGPKPPTLAANVDLLARLPLKFHPGTAYHYGLSTDVLGRVVEVASGLSLEEFFRKRIFEPLGMHDTHFNLPAPKASRIVPLFTVDKGALALASDQWGQSVGLTYFSGGAGLVSTITDYLRFAQMLLNGGELDGGRLLSRPTVELMMSSHTQDLGPSAAAPGHGFGYGGSVRESLGRSHRPTSEGTFAWSGVFGTYFWVDRKEQLVTILMHQLFPRSGRTAELFQALSYAAIQD